MLKQQKIISNIHIPYFKPAKFYNILLIFIDTDGKLENEASMQNYNFYRVVPLRARRN